MRTFVMPEARCPQCFEPLDGAGGPRRPLPGDLTFCVYCGAINEFQQDMTLRQLTDAEIALLPIDLKRQMEGVKRFVARHPPPSKKGAGN